MWIKRNVVMLPTNQKANLKSDLAINENNLLFQPSKLEGTWFFLNKYQHLYILSDEEIKKGDWFYDTRDKIISNSSLSQTLFSKKIIATTDTSLSIITKISLKVNNIIHSCDRYDKLPQIPQQFIEKYIEEYNKGNAIKEVLVKYEEEPTDDGNSIKYIELLINPNNTINIKQIKDSWNREEVKNLCFKAFLNHKLTSDKKWKQEDIDNALAPFEQWIKENL